MAWIDTYLRLKGTLGPAGPTGSVGLRGQGLRHIADITSYEDASVSGLFDVIREEQPYTFTSLPESVIGGVRTIIKHCVKDLAGNIYVTTFRGELAVKPHNSNSYVSLIPVTGSGIVPLNGLRPNTLGPLVIDNDTNTLYIADTSTYNPAVYKLVINDTNFQFSQFVPAYVNSANFGNITSLAITENRIPGQQKLLCVSGSGRIRLFGVSDSRTDDQDIYRYTSGEPHYYAIGSTAYTDKDRNIHVWITDIAHRVYEFVVRADTGTLDTYHIAGIGYPSGGDTGVDLDPLRTSLNRPTGITYQPSSDTLYFIDPTALYKIPRYLTNPSARRINKLIFNDPSTGQISVISPTGPVRLPIYGADGSIIHDTSGNLYIPFQSDTNPVLRLTTWNVDILERGELPLDGDYINWSKTSPDGIIVSTAQWLYVTTNRNAVLSTFEKVGTWIKIETTGTGAAVAGSVGAVSSTTGSIGYTGPSEIGPRGPAGPAQDYAPVGERGETGLQGPAGPAGPVGYVGEYGDTGPTGYNGYMGEEGPRGQTGARGVQGVRHANFYKDTPFPTTTFPEDGLPGDYYIKNDSQALYFYSEAEPDDTYYLNRVINTGLDVTEYSTTYGTSSSNITGNPLFTIPTNSEAQSNYNAAVTAYTTAVEAYYNATLEQRNTNTALSDNVRIGRRAFDYARSLLNASKSNPRRFAGPTGAWTTVGSPFLYEFDLSPNSRRTAGGGDYTNDAQYAFVFINKTFVPELFVVAGNVNPVDSKDPSYVVERKLFIVSMCDFSQVLPGTQFQIIWLPKNKTVNPIIPQNSVLGTYIGISINQVVGSTPTQNNGYILSAFFLDYYIAEPIQVKYDINNVVPNGVPVNMLYAKNGFPIKGNNPDQLSWLIKHHYGGLIELQLQITTLDMFSSRYAFPTVPGTYAIINNVASETNTPFVVIDNNISLVNTVQHPQLTYTFLVNGTTGIPLTYNEINSAPLAVTTDIAGNVYYARFIGNNNKTVIIKLPKASLQTNNYIYDSASILLGREAINTIDTDDGRLANNTYAQFIYGMTTDSQGGLYYSDTRKHCIRKIGLDGTVTTVAGVFGTAGWSGVGQAVKLNYPRGIYYDSANDHLYVADTGNHRIVRYSFNTQISEPTLIIGGSANNRPGVQPSVETTLSNVLFCAPENIVLDENGFLYVADTFNSAVWKIDLENEISSLFAGTWNFGGYDVGLTPEPPPQLSPWDIANIVLTVLSVLAVIAVAVFTGGAAAPAAGPIIARTMFTGSLRSISQRIALQSSRNIIPQLSKPIIQQSSRRLIEESSKRLITESARVLVKQGSKNVLTGSSRGLTVGSGAFTQATSTPVTAAGTAAARSGYLSTVNGKNAATAATTFIRVVKK